MAGEGRARPSLKIDFLFDDHRLEREERAILRLDRNLNPVDVRAAVCLHSREVREEMRLVDQGLVNLEEMRVTMNQKDMAGKVGRLSASAARNAV